MDTSKMTPEDRMHRAAFLAQCNPNGFRNPGRHGTSLVERYAYEADVMSDLGREESKRGKKKREMRAIHRATVRRQKAEGLESSRVRRKLAEKKMAKRLSEQW